MSIFKLNPTDFQSVTVTTNPSRNYSSSSIGVTGSVRVFSRKSFVEKDIENKDDPSTSFNESSIFNSWNTLKSTTKNKINIFQDVNGFLTKVNSENLSLKKQKVLDVIRFTPSDDYKNFQNFVSGNFYFTSGIGSINNLKKLAIKDNLSHYYRTAYPSAHWGYCNYHSLNFFSSSTVPTSSVLLYPNVDDKKMPVGYSTGRYAVSGAFSLDFYINPRYRNLDSNGHFKAGTIFHLSSSYALSLITGSLKDVNGLPSTFRLQLQLSHSADISPSTAIAGNYPKDLIFLSEDNSLKLNNWHHVVVRWGTNNINHGTGSFNIDGIDKGVFVVPSGTIAPFAYANDTTNPANPDALCIGNYYEGNNIGNNKLKRFFAHISSLAEGTYTMDTSAVESPDSFSFNHPLQAEVHDLSIKRFYVTDSDILTSSSTGISDFTNVCFYLPPFFTVDSPIRQLSADGKGVFITPRIALPGMTTTPFNVGMSFGVDGHYINTENFLKDFSSNYYPRQLFLTGTAITQNFSSEVKANEILYNQPEIRKRNLLILPCDDGNFYPNYDVIKTENIFVIDKTSGGSNPYNETKKFTIDPKKVSYVDDIGNYLQGFITLNNMLNDVSRQELFNNDKLNELITFTPQFPLKSYGSSVKSKYVDPILNDTFNNSILKADKFFVTQSQIPLSIPFITKDTSSNQVVFFDISNLFYGIRILPGSFMITDSAITGSGGAVSITIRDDGNGTLYRADSLTPHCTWNSVGTIFYNEGIIAIKSPHLYFFGQEQYEMSFKGEQNLHVLRTEVLAPQNYLNSSSNPSYTQVPSTNRPNEQDPNFVYITGINFHDDNLNVIMKTQLAQPIMKRHSEKILFRIKYDF
jgi:hypothetical protein